MKTICWGRVGQGGDSAEIQGFLLARVVQATALQVRCLGHSVVAVSGQRCSEGSPPSRTGMFRRVPSLKDWDAQKGPRPQGLGCGWLAGLELK